MNDKHIVKINMWFWSVFTLLSDLLIKTKRAACDLNQGSLDLSQKIKVDWFQRILVTEDYEKHGVLFQLQYDKKNT